MQGNVFRHTMAEYMTHKRDADVSQPSEKASNSLQALVVKLSKTADENSNIETVLNAITERLICFTYMGERYAVVPEHGEFITHGGVTFLVAVRGMTSEKSEDPLYLAVDAEGQTVIISDNKVKQVIDKWGNFAKVVAIDSQYNL